MSRTRILIVLTVATLNFGAASPPTASIVIDHNVRSEANKGFRFKTVPAPAKDDAGAKAKVTLVDSQPDPAAAGLSALTDGNLPGDEDDPAANFFFRAGSFGGRFRMDLGNAIDVAQVNTYSWHSGSRGPQLYKLYASDGSDPKFQSDPKRGVDPATCGWTFIATVNTLPDRGEEGGQYGASVSDPSGSLGHYRYLLFDCYVTETSDDFGNTFYSEVDVVSKK